MKIKSIPKSGRKGTVVYSEGRFGKVAREYVPPSNPRTPEQQDHRNNVRAVTGRWHTLSAEQRAAWCAWKRQSKSAAGGGPIVRHLVVVNAFQARWSSSFQRVLDGGLSEPGGGLRASSSRPPAAQWSSVSGCRVRSV
jgi:hypothetical protein